MKPLKLVFVEIKTFCTARRKIFSFITLSPLLYLLEVRLNHESLQNSIKVYAWGSFLFCHFTAIEIVVFNKKN